MNAGPRLAGSLLLALVAATSGCGVPQDGETTPIAGEKVPYALLGPAPSDTPAVPATGSRVTTPRVYFVNSEQQLTPERLTLVPDGLGPVVEALLERLSGGPTEQERARGFASALGPGTTLHLQRVADGVASIELTLPAQDPSADRLPLAVGQIVLTVTSVAGIDRVQLLQDGQPVQVPLPGGAQSSQPVGRLDYAPLVAPRATPPTKAPAGSGPSTPTSSPTPHPSVP